MKAEKYLTLAAAVAVLKNDGRQQRHGAVGVREDGVMVSAYNGRQRFPEPLHHAERRLLRKLGRGGTVYVVRVGSDGKWAYSRPCVFCEAAMRARDVRYVVYSMGADEWATLKL